MNYLFNYDKISFANILKVLSLQINAYAVKNMIFKISIFLLNPYGPRAI